MAVYDTNAYYIDFSNREGLTDTEKSALESIQQLYRPIERVDLLIEFKINNKITSDDFEIMTGLPYNYDL